jgi:hypothetical protein
MFSPAKATEIRRGLHASHQWLDAGDDSLVARCPRHGQVLVDRSLVAEALSEGKKHLQSRGGTVILA